MSEQKTYMRIVAKKDSKCPSCDDAIEEGDHIYYCPQERKAYCRDCGEELAE